ncbi:MAG: hypothetical protein HC833_04155 [Leptolyngbyaceae cyanobacterium RM1_406_9]|nr:hypothetical protein [Leptolyngbyaceae cyanobacterium RM1_406_9]
MYLLTWHRCLSDQTLERWIDWTGFVAVTLGKLALEDFHTVFIILDNL